MKNDEKKVNGENNAEQKTPSLSEILKLRKPNLKPRKKPRRQRKRERLPTILTAMLFPTLMLNMLKVLNPKRVCTDFTLYCLG